MRKTVKQLEDELDTLQNKLDDVILTLTKYQEIVVGLRSELGAYRNIAELAVTRK